ncbi:MAG: carboxypeptidase regulatory-like domain-containing protein [Herpetosiphon sp.]|nr:carboxypeptidase regulatory-like domain-containing protein [Herpetosiphon sp.]
MNTTHLTEALLDGSIRSINFFNGRLLSGDDLKAEQQANHEHLHQIGRVIGAGVSFGLAVKPASDSSATTPRLSIGAGLAVNRAGQVLELRSDVNLALTAYSPDQPLDDAGFKPCRNSAIPLGGYLSGAGYYMLVLSPATIGQGRAPTSGLGNNAAVCNTRYVVEGVQFRLVAVRLQQDLGINSVQNPDQLRNRIAYAAFGLLDQPLFNENPFLPNAPSNPWAKLVQAQLLTECDVPLALLRLTTAGIEFVDMWTVRRRVTAPSASLAWEPLLADQNLSHADAMILQFQDQLDALIRDQSTNAKPITIQEYFAYLPPTGFVPASLKWQTFLGDHAPAEIKSVDAGWLKAIFLLSRAMSPIDVQATPRILLDLYNSPDQPDVVLFTRSLQSELNITVVDARTQANLGTSKPPASVTLKEVNRSTTPNSDGVYRFADLDPETYLIEITMDGYQPVNQPVIATAGHAQTIQIQLGKVKPQDNQPRRCITTKIQQIAVAQRSVRFCLLPDSVVFDTRINSSLIPIDDQQIPISVIEWLGAWQTWFAQAYPEETIDRGKPKLFFPSPSRIRTLQEQISDAFARSRSSNSRVFAPVQPSINELSAAMLHDRLSRLPLTTANDPGEKRTVMLLLHASSFTRSYVLIEIETLPDQLFDPSRFSLERIKPAGVKPNYAAMLADRGIRYADELIAMSPQTLGDMLGYSEDYARSLIDDVRAEVITLSKDLRSYDGVDAEIVHKLNDLSIYDDVALANADHASLTNALGSTGFATRLIEQARQRVPADAWQLEQLNLSNDVIAKLATQGINSKGELLTQLATRADLVPIVGDADQIRASAIKQLSASSLSLKPTVNLSDLPTINPTMRDTLAAHNITTADALATMSNADLARITGLAEPAAQTLREQVKDSALATISLNQLAGITNDQVQKLQNINVGELATKTPNDISNAFNGNLELASAVIEGARLGLTRRIG